MTMLDFEPLTVIGSRYLADPAPFEAYLRQCDESATKIRQKIEELQGSQSSLRTILLARAKAQEEKRTQADQG